MQELRVEIAWRGDGDRLEHLTDITPVIPAVDKNVEKGLLPGHATSIAVGENEGEDLRQSWGRKAGNVTSVPGICGFDVGPELLERWGCLRIRSVKGYWLPTKVGSKDSVDDVDVVEGTDASVKLIRMLWR